MDNKLFGLSGLDFSPELNMVRYLQSIRKYPILAQEEEYELAVRISENQRQQNCLQTCYLPFEISR